MQRQCAASNGSGLPRLQSARLVAAVTDMGVRASRHQFMRYGTALALTTLFIVGCATSERSHRATVLSLPYSEFDQAYGDGWRSVFERGEGLAAVALIEDYLNRHTELTFGQRKFLHLHAAQVLALEGRNNRAVRHLDAAASHQKSPELWPDWDDFIAATRAFLVHDRASLVAARERLAAANAPRLKMADRLLEKFGHSYADVIWWIRVCTSVAVPKDAPARQSAAAATLAKALGCSVMIAETNPPPCCIWLELRPFSPGAVPKGYVIIHSADGTIIAASDPEWLDDAVHRFIKSSRDTNGYWEAPFGVSSNFDPSQRVRPLK